MQNIHPCNKAYNNGINGLVVHKTDRVHVVGNVIWDNGQVDLVDMNKEQTRPPLCQAQRVTCISTYVESVQHIELNKNVREGYDR